VKDLRDAIRVFIDQREWEQFHSPKNLAMALSVEVAEIETQKKGPGVGGTRALVLSSEALLGAQGPKEGSGGYVPFVLLIYAQGFQADKADWGER